MNTCEAVLTHFYLKPGEIFISDKPAVVRTVLGSCISVTMFNPERGIGAICHGLLPQCNELNSCTCACVAGFKYVDCSIRKMLGKLYSLGIANDGIEVKMFGGADMFKTIRGRPNAINVGEQNIISAIKVLSESNLRPADSDVGGTRGRQIIFIPHTGEVYLKRLKVAEAGALKYCRSLKIAALQ